MHGPPVVTCLSATVCAGTGAYCLVVSMRGRATAGAAAVASPRAEAVMGLSMAAMVLPGSTAPLPSVFFVVLFGALAVLSGRSACAGRGTGQTASGRRGHHLHHMVEAAAMAYMAAAMLAPAPATAPSAHHGGASAAGIPLVTGGFLVYFAAFALRTGARLASAGAAHGPTAAPTPETTAACRVALALVSFTMLLTL